MNSEVLEPTNGKVVKMSQPEIETSKVEDVESTQEERIPLGYEWKADDIIQISGGEYAVLKNYFDFLGRSMSVVNEIQKRMIDSGISKPKYE